MELERSIDRALTFNKAKASSDKLEVLFPQSYLMRPNDSRDIHSYKSIIASLGYSYITLDKSPCLSTESLPYFSDFSMKTYVMVLTERDFIIEP